MSAILVSCAAADGGLTAAGPENTEKRLHPAALHALTLAETVSEAPNPDVVNSVFVTVTGACRRVPVALITSYSNS
jgi:hypothetical protein